MDYRTLIVWASVSPPTSLNSYAEIDLQVNKILKDKKYQGFKLVSISVLDVQHKLGGYFLVTISK